MNNQKTKSTKLAKMAMLVAISIVLVMLIHFPIFPAVFFLEYDPADIPILIGTFAFTLAGIILTVVTSVIQGLTVSAASGAYGILMHILATTALVSVSGLVYKTQEQEIGDYRPRSRNRCHDCGNVLCQYDNYTAIYGYAACGSYGTDAVYSAVQCSQSRNQQRGDFLAVQENFTVPAQIKTKGSLWISREA